MYAFGEALQIILFWPTSHGTQSSYNLLQPAFIVGSILVIAHVASMSIVSGQAIASDVPSGAAFSILKYTSAFCRGIGFVPTCIWLLGPFICGDHDGWSKEADCMDAGATAFAVIGTSLLCVHMTLSCIEFLTLTDHNPKGGLRASISGRPHLVVQLLYLIAAVVTFFSSETLSAIAGIATTLVSSLSSIVVLFFYLPYFDHRVNLLFMSSACWGGWVALMRLVSWQGGVFSAATAFTAVVLLPVSWMVAYALLKWRQFKARVLPLDEATTSADIRLKIYELLDLYHKLGLNTENALDIVGDVLRHASGHLRANSGVHMLYDHFLFYHRRNKYLEQSQIELLVDKSTAIDALFYAFRRRLQLSEEQDSGAHMGVAARIQFDRKQIEALQSSVRTRSKLLAFWVELADSKEPNVSEVHRLAGALSEHVFHTKAAFEELMSLNPSHVGLLRQYAQFLLEVSNDVDKGQALLDEADNIEDNASRRHAQSHGSFSFMGKSSLDASDEGVGILTASAAAETLGEVTSCNANALRMFGYARREIIGKGISSLMPEPIASFHNALLERYLTSGVERVTGTTRMVFGLNRTRTIFPMFLHVKSMDVGFGALMMPFRTTEGFIIFSGRAATVQAACQRSLSKLRLGPEEVAVGQVSLHTICPNLQAIIRSSATGILPTAPVAAVDTSDHIPSDAQSVTTSASRARHSEDTKTLHYCPSIFNVQNTPPGLPQQTISVSVRITKHEYRFPKQTSCFVLQWKEADSARLALKAPSAATLQANKDLTDKKSVGSDSVGALLDDERGSHVQHGSSTQGDGDLQHATSQHQELQLANTQDEQHNPLADAVDDFTPRDEDKSYDQTQRVEDNYTSDSRSHAHSARTSGSATSALQTLRRLVTQSEKALDPGLRILRNAFAAIFALTVLVTSISSGSVISKLSAFAEADTLLHTDASRQLKVLQIEFWVRSLDLNHDKNLLHFPGDPRRHLEIPSELYNADVASSKAMLTEMQRHQVQEALNEELAKDTAQLDFMSQRVYDELRSPSFRAAHAESVQMVPAILRLHTDRVVPVVQRREAQVVSETSSLLELTSDFVAAANDVSTAFKLANSSHQASTSRDFIHDNFDTALRSQQKQSVELLQKIQVKSFSSLYSVPEQVFLVIAAIADIVLLAGVIPLIQRVESANDRVVAAFLNVPQTYLQNLRKKCKVNLDRLVYSLAAEGDEEDEVPDFDSNSETGSEGEAEGGIEEAKVPSSALTEKKRQRLFGLNAKNAVASGRQSKKSQASFFFLLLKFGGPMIALLVYLMSIYFWTFTALHDLQFSSTNIVLGYNRVLSMYSAGLRASNLVQLPAWNDAYRHHLNASIWLAWSDMEEAQRLNRELVFGNTTESRAAETLSAGVAKWMLDSACAAGDTTCNTFQDGAVQFNGLGNVLTRYLSDIEAILLLKSQEAAAAGEFVTGISMLDAAVAESRQMPPTFSSKAQSNRCSMRDRGAKSFDNTLASFAAMTKNSSWLQLANLDSNKTECQTYRREWARLAPLPDIQTLKNSYLLTGLLEVLDIKAKEVDSVVAMYSVGLIVVTVGVGILICVFFVFVYVPLVEAMDQSMKRTRSLLLLFPEDALMYIPSLKKAMRSAALGATQGVSTRNIQPGMSSRWRRVRNVSRVFPSRVSSASGSVSKHG